MSESDLKQRLEQDLVASRKRRDKRSTLLLSTVLADLKNAEIAKGGALAHEELLGVLTKAVKRRRDAAAQMREAGRTDRAEPEEWEADTLSEYLPAGLAEEDVRAIVRDLIAGGAASMGEVMGQLMPKVRGRFDGKEANRIVREELGH